MSGFGRRQTEAISLENPAKHDLGGFELLGRFLATLPKAARIALSPAKGAVRLKPARHISSNCLALRGEDVGTKY